MPSRPVGLEPGRVVADLQELARFTADKQGAQRVAWTMTWAGARRWLIEQLADLPVEVEVDPAGNLWATLPGRSERALALGSHLDSVPNGGWLDGALGVVAALEVLRRVSRAGTPSLTLRLVDWADEEGARFGRSLVGSGAAAGLLDGSELAGLVDHEGVSAREALAGHGVELERMADARGQLDRVVAYLELHIEQGCELERLDLPVAVVDRVLGVARHRVVFRGETAHAGATAMEVRRDALLSAAKVALDVRERAHSAGGRCTTGSIVATPGIVTAVSGEAVLLLDQRHETPELLEALEAHARAAADEIAAADGTTVEWTELLQTAPITFDPSLLQLAEEATLAVTGHAPRLASGALHDAAALALAPVPSAMLFVRSIGGRSHTREEDTSERDLQIAVRVLDQLVENVLSAG